MRDLVKKFLKFGLLGLLFIIIIIFAIINSHDVLFGAPLRINGLNDGMTVTKDGLSVSGQAPKTVDLKINDRSIPVDEKGNFEELLIVPVGYNIIEIESKDKFGHTTIKTFRVYRAE